MRTWLLPIALCLLALACTKNETGTTTGDTLPATTTSAAEPTAPPPPPPPAQAEPSLTSFASGALVVQSPAEYGGGWSARAIIDEYPDYGWATPQNDITPKTFVIELPERTALERLEFDTGSADGEKRGAKDILVEVSDTSAAAGFTKIAEVSLADQKDRQSFPVTAPAPGRWIRLTVRNNQGATDYVELMDFRGYGKQLTDMPMSNASGTYETNFGLFHLQQEGTAVTGCYEHDGGLLTGGIEKRVMKFTWKEGGGEDDQGPALMVLTADGNRMFGVYGSKDAERLTSEWNGKKVSNEVGSCPHWSPSKGGATQRIAEELGKAGRTRLYGINFDTDSDVIRAESKPTLDKVVAVLTTNAEWKIRIEGHTDASGGDAHNQELSQKRADAVKSYLLGNGIAAERVTAQGMGAGTPLASNDTPIGRSQNRRVELVKE
ncbi:MAG TPA: OmpA family protein [Thermoanaerobaculia bacterium]|nr:OmpA family protein [Thermoanaerobaculia bacterium]